MWGRLLKLAVAASLAASAWAHGYMLAPVARNVDASDCPHCLNAGGVGAVHPNNMQWPNGRHGVCGDPAEGEGAGNHEGGGKFEQVKGYRVTQYAVGDFIKIKIKLTANHLGYFQYSICVLPAGVTGTAERQHLTNDCFRRATPLQISQDGNWGDRYYIRGDVNDYEHSVRLPANLECQRCVLRWYWVSGNSCIPPGTPTKWKGGKNMGTCGTGVANPEQFWNCADIAITKKGAPMPPLPKSKSQAVQGDLGSTAGDPAPANGTAVGSYAGDPGPSQLSIEDTDTGEVIGDDDDGSGGGGSGGSGGGDDGGDDLISFENVLLSVVIGTGVGLPLLLVSPTLGATAGMSIFVLMLVLFMIINSNDDEGFRARPKKHS